MSPDRSIRSAQASEVVTTHLMHNDKITGTQMPREFLTSRLNQVFVYLALGLAIPIGIWSSARGVSLDQEIAFATWSRAVFAVLFIWYALDKLRQYARARLLSYVLPVNLASFGALIAIGVIWRLPYSITLFASIFFATLAASYVITALTRVSARSQYFIPGGRVADLSSEPRFIALSSHEEFQSLIESDRTDIAVTADLHFDHGPEWERSISQAALKGIPVYHYRQIVEQISGQVRITHLSENELGSLIPNLPYMAAKRSIDLFMVLLSLPLLLPLFILIAIAVKCDSKGPVLFVQERMGFRGETFNMIKFRTMQMGETSQEPSIKRNEAMTKDKDARITRIGRLLRKTRIDEWPQIWNIVEGHMSWIGPRPEAASLSDWYESEIPFYSYRHIVRPGITGWAQVNQGHVTDLHDAATKLRFDFYYVKNISLWLDILISFKTVRVIFSAFGAR